MAGPSYGIPASAASCASYETKQKSTDFIPTTELFKRLATAAELNLRASERLFESLHYREIVSCSGNSECKPMLTDNSIYSLIEEVFRNITAATARIDELTEKTSTEYPGISVFR